MRVHGFWFQANRSMRHEAIVELGPELNLRVSDEEEVNAYDLQQIKISPRVANIERWFQFPDGSGFTTKDNDAVDEWLEHNKDHSASRLLHTLESKKLARFFAVVMTVAIAALLLTRVIPATAPMFAELVPADVEIAIGRRVKRQLAGLSGLDEVTNESTRQRELRIEYKALVASIDSVYPYSLTYYRSMRANAFAVPGGVIYMSTAMFAEANDEELLAVLAHQIGHIEERHSLRHAMKQAGTVALISTLFGDFTGALGLGAVYLTGLSHSRDAEHSADAYAVSLFKKNNLNPDALVSYFQKRLKEQAEDLEKNGEKPNRKRLLPFDEDYLSTHPTHTDRIESMKRLIQEK